jgi:5'-3' exonuclease
LKTTLLIDADIVAYKIAAANEQRINWGVDEETGEEITSHIVNEDVEDIHLQLQQAIDKFMVDTEADDFLICLSDDNYNWRKKVLPSYKQHRKESIRPEWLYPAKDYLAEAFPSYRRNTLEADDVMGILSTHPKLVAGRKIIVSEDKDMKTIPGWLYNPGKDRKPRLVSEYEANLYHMEQTLTGDATDGYKGCPGAGPKAFLKLLEGWEEGNWVELWNRIVGVYESKDLTEKDAITQARVARICRHTDYNFTDKEVIYWNPPK